MLPPTSVNGKAEPATRDFLSWPSDLRKHFKVQPKPTPLPVIPDNIPAELKAIPQWVLWRYEWRDGKDGKPGKWTKVPINPRTGRRASSTDPATWSAFDEALACLRRPGSGFDGLGIAIENAGLTVWDLDRCRDPETGEIESWALDIVRRLNTYTELSPSRTGLHLFGRGRLPEGLRRKGRVEAYDSGRFIILTGHRLDGTPATVEERQAEINVIHAEVFGPAEESHHRKEKKHTEYSSPRGDDDALLARMFASKQGEKIRSLWDGNTDGHASPSEADLALCAYLAYWCEGDRGRIDRLFRWSKLMRPKWDEKHGSKTYGEITLDRALQDKSDFSAPEVDLAGIATLDDLASVCDRTEWIWEGWLQKSVVNAFAAEGGTGKTRTVADLIRRMRHGEDWPDGQPMTVPADGLKVLWVAADNNHSELVQVADEFGIKDCLYLNAPKSDPCGGVTLETPEDLAALESRIKVLRPTLVVIDTVGNATDLDLCRQENAKSFYAPLQVMAQKHNVCIIANTHTNAAGKILGRRAREKVRVVLMLALPDESDVRLRLWVDKSNGLLPDPLGVTLRDGRNDYDVDPPSGPGSGPGRSSRGQQAKCNQWLKGLVDGGERVKVCELLDEVDKLGGFGRGALYRAKKALGLEQSDDKPKCWWLPDPKVPSSKS